MQEESGMRMQSEDITELAKAMAKANLELSNVKRDKDNPYFKSRYSDLSTVYDSCRKILASNGVCVIQTTLYHNNEIVLVSTLMHESGQWIKGVYPLKPIKTDPQGYGSAMTYARRYSLLAIVGIASEDEDDDGNAANGKRVNNPSNGTSNGEKLPLKPNHLAIKSRIKSALENLSESKDPTMMNDTLRELTGNCDYLKIKNEDLEEILGKLIEAFKTKQRSAA